MNSFVRFLQILAVIVLALPLDYAIGQNGETASGQVSDARPCRYARSPGC